MRNAVSHRTPGGGQANISARQPVRLTAGDTDRLLRTVWQLQAENGFGPTFQEIATALGFKTASTALRWMDAARDAGLVSWTPNVARTARLTTRGLDRITTRTAA